jgi:hypothetical protein
VQKPRYRAKILGFTIPHTADMAGSVVTAPPIRNERAAAPLMPRASRPETMPNAERFVA